MKGSIMDIPVILIMLMSGIITVIICAFILVSINTQWQSQASIPQESKDIMAQGVSTMYMFDGMIIFFAVGMSLFSIVSAFFIRTHPIFFIFSIIVLGFVVMFSAQVTNALDMFLTASAWGTLVNNFPLTVILVRNFPLFSLVIGLLIAVASYSRGGERQGFGGV